MSGARPVRVVTPWALLSLIVALLLPSMLMATVGLQRAPIVRSGPVLGPLPLTSPALVTPSASDLASVFTQAQSFWLAVLPGQSADQSHGDNQVAAAAPGPGEATGVVSQAEADAALATAVAAWAAAGHDVPALSAAVVDLPDLVLGHSSGALVQVDVDAAGHGWGAGGMDLASVVRHEVGHAVGLGHDAGGVMATTLAAGAVVTSIPAVEAEQVDQSSAPAADAAAAEDTERGSGTEEEPATSDATDAGATSDEESDDEAAASDDSAPDPTAAGDVEEPTGDDAVEDPADGGGVAGGDGDEVVDGPIDDDPGTDGTGEDAAGDASSTSTVEPAAEESVVAAATDAVVDAGEATTVDSIWVVEDGVATARLADGAQWDHELRLADSGAALVAADGTVDEAPDGVALVVIGGAGSDRIRLVGSTSRSVQVDGGGGVDTLVGPGGDLDWTVTGTGAGAVAGIDFAGFEYLVGAADTQDTFTIAEGGALTGGVDGGDRGYDTLVVASSSTSAVYRATGPDAGVVTLDGASFTYAGLEPVYIGGDGTGSVTANLTVQTDTGGVDNAVLQTVGSSTTQLELAFTTASAETHIFDIPTASLTIELGAGNDTLKISAGVMALLAGIHVTIDGGTGDDTLQLDDDIPGQWDIESIDAGTWTQDDDGTLTVAPFTFAFADIQHIVGAATEADAVDFSAEAGLTGSFDDRAGALTVGAAGFVSVSGTQIDVATRSDLDWESLTTTGSVGAATVLTVSGSGGTGLIGAEVMDSPAGVQGTLGDFALAIVTNGTQAWHVFEGTLTDPSFVLPGVDIDTADLTIEVNTLAGDETWLDLSTNSITAGGVTLDADAPDIFATTTTTITLGDFVFITGELTIRLGGTELVEVATGLPTNLLDFAGDAGLGGFVNEIVGALADIPRLGDAGLNLDTDLYVATDLSRIYNLPVSATEITFTSGTIFVGYAPEWNDTIGPTANNGLIEEGELGDDAVGLFANGISLAFLTFATKLTDNFLLNRKLPAFKALVGDIDDVEFVGWDAIELSGTDIHFEINDGTPWPGGFGPPVIDFAATFPDAPVGWQVETAGDPIAITFDGNQRIGASIGKAVFTIDEVLQVAGNVAFEKGPTALVDVATKFPAEVKAALRIFIDAATKTTAVIDALQAVLTPLGAGALLDILFADFGGGDYSLAIPILTEGQTKADAAGSLAFSFDFGTLYNLEVATVQFGGSNISAFLGYNPGWQDGVCQADDPDTSEVETCAAGSTPEDGVIQSGELLPDAVGLFAEDISFGMATFEPTIPGLPQMQAVRFGLDVAAFLGGGLFSAAVGGLDVYANSGKPWPGGKLGSPTINFASSFAAENPGDDDDADGRIGEPAGFEVGTGDPDNPVYLDFAAGVTGFVAEQVLLSIGDYVTVTGGMTWEKGSSQIVDVATGLPANVIEYLTDAITDLPEPLKSLADLIETQVNDLVGLLSGTAGTAIDPTWASITNVSVGVMKGTVTDASVFVGFDSGFDGTVMVDGTDGSIYLAGDDGGADCTAGDEARNGLIDECELGDDATGILVSDVDFGMVVMTPSLKSVTGLEWLPTFTALRLNADLAKLVGVDAITATLTDIEIQVNDGDPWPGDLGPPVVNFADSYPAEDAGTDPNGNGRLGEPAGYLVNPDSPEDQAVYLDYDGNQRIRVTVGGAELRISDFFQVTGSVFFEMGPTTKVDIATGFSTELRIGLQALYGNLNTSAYSGAIVTAATALATGFGLDVFTLGADAIPVADCTGIAEADWDTECKPAQNGLMTFSPDFKKLWNLEMGTMVLGADSVSLFAGLNSEWQDGCVYTTTPTP